ncbi:MAG: hypothetical protein KAI29_16560, partial [Cyclobacteriaceae bacterium]|nr:hypothetical protein [Cyclobacteriaceae bacterium]
DLQKAEAQAREAQIEAALEKVRARGMAMHHSDELADASFILDSQVRALGIKTWGCAFNIYGEGDSSEWFSTEDGVMPTFKIPRERIFLRYYDIGQSGESLHIEEFTGKKCSAHYDYLCTLPIVGDALRQIKESGGSFPTSQIDHVTYFKHGYLLFITFEPVPEAHDIFKRFAKVFEQTYTRFLDLKKAEAQTREAQIETALERVRSRSMAMHKSDELSKVIVLINEEMLNLGVDQHTSIIITDLDWDDPASGANCWVASEDESYFRKFHIPIFDHLLNLNLVNAYKNDISFYSDKFSKEDKNSYFEYLFEYSDFKEIPSSRKNKILNSPGISRSVANLKNSVMVVQRYSNEEF